MEDSSVSKGVGPDGTCGPDRRFGVRGRARRTARDEGGQALVEFALVIPVLMLILLGILKFGILYNNYLQLTDAVRSGARQMSIERGQGDPCGDAAGALIASANLGSGLTVKITDSNPADSADFYTFAAPSGPGVRTVPDARVRRCRDRGGHVSLRSQLHGDKLLLRLHAQIERDGTSRMTRRPSRDRSLAMPTLRSKEGRASVPRGRAPRNSS